VPEKPAAGLEDVLDLVAAFLPDRSAACGTARFARCCAHFRSYLLCSAAELDVACCGCGCQLRFRVVRHDHSPAPYITFFGERDGESYVWNTRLDRVACAECARCDDFDRAAECAASDRAETVFAGDFAL